VVQKTHLDEIALSDSLRKLREYAENEGFKGYDPYDALNSPILNTLSMGSKLFRIIFTQTLKRFPINLRAFLNIKKDYNPKGLGLFLWGYAKLFKVEEKDEYLEKIRYLLRMLENLRSRGYSGNCWGYNFDWQSRNTLLPKFTPTIVNSSFIGQALIDVYKYTKIEKALEMAVNIKDFILKDLNRTEENGAICFSYTPIDHTPIHNANLLGASLLIRLFKYSQDHEVKDIALSSLAYSMKYQKKDGSWPYGESGLRAWIDSFHTGFNLQSILYFLEEGFADEYTQAFEKGVTFYAENFFLSDGTPKYYHNKIYPIDVHSPAQAVVFFSRMGETYRELAKQIVQWMINNLQNRAGFFYFQKSRYYINKIPYIRWAQAWAFHALTEYKLNKQQGIL
jgi:rhamnogalacturonyl hydrolase YesR